MMAVNVNSRDDAGVAGTLMELYGGFLANGVARRTSEVADAAAELTGEENAQEREGRERNGTLLPLGVRRGIKGSLPRVTGRVTVDVWPPRDDPRIGRLMSTETESRHSVATDAD